MERRRGERVDGGGMGRGWGGKVRLRRGDFFLNWQKKLMCEGKPNVTTRYLFPRSIIP